MQESLSNTKSVVDILKLRLISDSYRFALYYKGSQYSYYDLFHLSKKVSIIIASYAVTRVAILLDRNDVSIILMLGCAIAGVEFIPLHINNPISFNIDFCDQIRPDVIFCLPEYVALLNRFLTVCVTNLKSLLVIYDLISHKFNKNNHHFNDNLFGIILSTSGSTGSPKAVRISNQNILAYIKSFIKKYPIKTGERFIQISEINFDPLLHDLFICWATAGCVFIYPNHLPIGLGRFIQKHRISIWTSVPSTLIALIKQSKNTEVYHSILWTILGGERLTVSLCQRWRNHAPKTKIVNCYGPTEATVAVISSLVVYDYSSSSLFCPLGKPHENVNTKLINKGREVLLSNIAGECYLSGPQVVDGYMNNAQLTSSSFVYYNNQIWYRTGDIMKYNEFHDFIFLGRLDNQIKIRGYRVDLKYVEELLSQFSNQLSVAVIAIHADDHCDYQTAAKTEIIAFFESDNNTIIISNSVLSKIMPSYMIPAKILFLRQIPKLMNGKINYPFLRKLYLNEYN